MLTYGQERILREYDKIKAAGDEASIIYWINTLQFADCQQLMDALRQRAKK